MIRTIFASAVAAVTLLGAADLEAQQGFALKGGLVFNESEFSQATGDSRVPDANGFSIGLEYVLPGGLGLGLTGYTTGSPDDFEISEGSLVMLAEANYFLQFPLLPVSPYLGLNAGLGTYDFEDVQDRVRPEVDFGDVGWQIGVRFQPISLIGVDAQYRRVNGSARTAEDVSLDLESDQIVIGVTLF